MVCCSSKGIYSVNMRQTSILKTYRAPGSACLGV